MVRISNVWDWTEIESDKTGQSGFGMLTVYGENTYFHYQLLAISKSMVQITLKYFI
jgi:hypothetical protein